LVIAVDSEEQSRQEKLQEIQDHVDALRCPIQYIVIVQHFCLETWAIGNRRIFPRHIHDPKVLEYKKLYDVSKKDPELLPLLEAEALNRAQFCYKYLRLILRQKYKRLSYTKSNPGPLLNDKYFHQVKLRYEETGHINSFDSFLTAFV
jgi:hypothetical protein